ncbi:MFS transporter [Pseudomonas sp. M5]|uniref:MFS transporter n=1 Tax=Pseudomonas sp. M5 TaxID=1620788 RepID=UPI00195DBB14|nr:MFS transporter [Pseudomonas sp. M5]MBM7396695.1 DHA2 family methylenomycin A resistance protein-like MFS transporter [Pseudomonas sp. M5]HDS1758387.1 MFS transporter [Pseudomonas putida]
MRSDHQIPTLIACSLAYGLVLMDPGFISVALGAIQRDLVLSGTDLRHIVSIYNVALASCLILAGSLCDHIGSKRALLVGVVLYAGGSAMFSLSEDLSLLLLARAGQGVGASLLIPGSLSLLNDIFQSPREKMKAIGWWGGFGSIAMALSPLCAGLLLSHVDWATLFYLNVVLSVIILILLAPLPMARRRRDVAPFDAVTHCLCVTFTGGLVVLLTDRGSPSYWLCALVLTALLMIVIRESRGSIKVFHRPLVFKPSLLACYFAGTVINFSFYGVLFYFSLSLARDSSVTPISTALALLPGTGVLIVGYMLTGRYASPSRFSHFLGAGGLITIFGLMIFTLFNLGSGLVFLMTGLSLVSFGLALITPIVTGIVLAQATSEVVGVANGVFNTCRQFGVCFGIATFFTAHDAEDGLGLNPLLWLTIFLVVVAVGVTSWVSSLTREHTV